MLAIMSLGTILPLPLPKTELKLTQFEFEMLKNTTCMSRADSQNIFFVTGISYLPC
jgi:hypothetical protein